MYTCHSNNVSIISSCIIPHLLYCHFKSRCNLVIRREARKKKNNYNPHAFGFHWGDVTAAAEKDDQVSMPRQKITEIHSTILKKERTCWFKTLIRDAFGGSRLMMMVSSTLGAGLSTSRTHCSSSFSRSLGMSQRPCCKDTRRHRWRLPRACTYFASYIWGFSRKPSLSPRDDEQHEAREIPAVGGQPRSGEGALWQAAGTETATRLTAGTSASSQPAVCVCPNVCSCVCMCVSKYVCACV